MNLKVIIFGSTGMVGHGVLLQCLEDSRVEKVLLVNRTSLNVTHPKLSELIHNDFSDYQSIQDKLVGYDACFYCLGISSWGLSESKYSKITYDYTVAAARVLVEKNPGLTFCFVSGAGTDSSEKGKVMWARVKGKAENALKAMSFKSVYCFRPGYIQPMRGVKSKTKLYQFLYDVFGFLYPLLKVLIPHKITNTDNIGRAMIHCALGKSDWQYLENKEINTVAQTNDDV